MSFLQFLKWMIPGPVRASHAYSHMIGHLVTGECTKFTCRQCLALVYDVLGSRDKMSLTSFHHSLTLLINVSMCLFPKQKALKKHHGPTNRRTDTTSCVVLLLWSIWKYVWANMTHGMAMIKLYKSSAKEDQYTLFVPQLRVQKSIE